MLFAVSDVVWQAAIGGAVTIVLSVVSGIGTVVLYRMQINAAKKVDKVAADLEIKTANTNKKLENVKTTLEDNTAATDEKLANLAKVAEATHTLVNSAMGRALALTAETARAKAQITCDRADLIAADLAEKMLKEHMAKQAKVDSDANKLSPH